MYERYFCLDYGSSCWVSESPVKRTRLRGNILPSCLDYILKLTLIIEDELGIILNASKHPFLYTFMIGPILHSIIMRLRLM